MLSNLLAAALRNMSRNRLYAAISIAGLTLGIAAVILTALYVRNEYGFDRFIPGHEQTYAVTSDLQPPGQTDIVTDYAPSQVAAFLRLQYPDAKVARLAYGKASLQRGEIEAQEDVAWVDPGFFEILPLPTIAGSLAGAMSAPDAIVITRSVARKYFGRDKPVGEVLMLDRQHPLRIVAVIEDFPPETHISQQVFGSGQAPFSALTRLAERRRAPGFTSVITTPRPGQAPPFKFEYVRLRTYVRASASAVSSMRSTLAEFGARQSAAMKDLPAQSQLSFGLVPISELHLQAFKGAKLGVGEANARGDPAALKALGVLAVLVLGLAVINFVNLTTARAAQRAVEIGVRKTAGAQRSDLILQFIGEAFLYVLASTIIAIALVELLLPAVNAALMRQIAFPYWREPGILALLLTGTVVVALLAGAYPALVLSRFRPAIVLNGGPVETSGSGLVRQGLVVAQFAVLVALIIAVAVVWRQTQYAMNGGLHLDKDQVLVVYATPCRSAFEQEVRQLPGVKAAACSSRSMLGLEDFDPTKFVMEANQAGEPAVPTDIGLVDFGLFELYGVKPIAGRVFSRSRPGDALPPQVPNALLHGPVVINDSAARRLGFTTPTAALNRTISMGPGYGDFTIAGVVPDFTLDLLNAKVKPTIYLVDFANYPADQVLNIKLDGQKLPETLAKIDGLWKQTGQEGVIHRQFVDEYVQQIYLGTIRQGYLITALSAIALFLACFGLLGLAAFTTERRTREIGVRKAMGAATSDILKLLMWQFTKPVLWGILVAWPLAWWLMSRWLEGFAYRVALSPLIFFGAACGAVMVAWTTVGSRAWLAARARPVQALRHD